MRRMVTVVAVAALFVFMALTCAAAAEPSFGEVRVAAREVLVRLKPEPGAHVVRVLKPGDRVRVDFPQPGGFVALFDLSEGVRDLTRAMGYAEAAQLDALAQAQAAAGKTAAAKAAPGAAAETRSEVKASAAATPPAKVAVGAAQDPVRITSDKMVYSQTENAVVFSGNVHGAQADMAIWAAKLTAYFADKARRPGAQQEGGGADLGGGKIDRIVAEGDVRLVAGKNEGACGQLTYFVNEGVLRMEGNPILREGQNTVRGDVIKYYLKEKRSEVLSGAQRRVEAVFFTPDSGR